MDKRYGLTRQELISLSIKTTAFYFLFLGLLVMIPVVKIWASKPKYPEFKHHAFLVLEDKTLKIQKVETDEERAKGLSNFQSLESDQGMFFVFDKPDFYSIWMKDMNFAIDVIWLDNNFKVIDFVENLKPETYPKTFKPKTKAKYVLEVNAGFVSKNKVSVGDQATIFSK